MRCKTCNRVIVTKDLSCPHCDYGSNSVSSSSYQDENLEKAERPQTFSKYSKRPSYEGKRGLFAVTNLYKQAFNFKGETDWLEYWTQQLYLILVYIVIAVLRFVHLDPTSTLPSIGVIILYSLAALSIISVLPNISSTVRRLQNAGYSGYLYFLVFIPIIGVIIVLFLTLAPAE